MREQLEKEAAIEQHFFAIIQYLPFNKIFKQIIIQSKNELLHIIKKKEKKKNNIS